LDLWIIEPSESEGYMLNVVPSLKFRLSIQNHYSWCWHDVTRAVVALNVFILAHNKVNHVRARKLGDVNWS